MPHSRRAAVPRIGMTFFAALTRCVLPQPLDGFFENGPRSRRAIPVKSGDKRCGVADRLAPAAHDQPRHLCFGTSELDAYPHVVDMLRNEKPVFFTFVDTIAAAILKTRGGNHLASWSLRTRCSVLPVTV